MSESFSTSNNQNALPTEGDYLGAIAAVVDEYQIDSEQSLTQALAVNIRATPGFRHFHGRAFRLAQSIEPRHEMNRAPVDGMQRRSTAMYKGLGFGGLMLPYLYGDDLEIRSVFEQGESTASVAESELEQFDETVELLLETGAREIGPVIDGVLEEIEARVVPPIAQQRYFRVGCGVLMAYAYQAYENQLAFVRHQDLQDFKQTLAGNPTHDWDLALEQWRNDG